MKEFKTKNVLNLEGEVCPFTFVYTKLKLEEMDKDELLEVIIDYELAIENVPRSVVSQNLGKCLDIVKVGDKKWKLLIQRI
ncbi:MAG: sulfurtransferase TusA family protein [Candidatus Helarchaeota archaeon]